MLTKKQQTARNGRLKPKPDKNKDYLAWFHQQGFKCLVCDDRNIEAHHVKEHSNDAKDDTLLLPLCPLHHRLSLELSPHGAPNKWREKYPIMIQNMIAKSYYLDYIGEKF